MGDVLSIDHAIFEVVNGLCGRNWALDHFLGHIQDDNLIRGGLALAAFWALWHQPPKNAASSREILITMLLAATLSVVIARGLSLVLPFRLRPMFDPTILYRTPLDSDTITYDLEDWSSFPSDNAAFFFALTTGFWLVSRPLAVAFGVLSAFLVVLPRIFFGIHYPGDIIGGAVIGVGVTLGLERIRTFIAAPFFAVERRLPAAFYGAMFLFAFEAANLFVDARHIGKSVFRMVRHYASL